MILEWYKLLKPFDKGESLGRYSELRALADDLAQNAIHDIVWSFIILGGIWTVVLVLLYLSEGWKTILLFGLLGYIIIIGFIFHVMKDRMESRLEKYAEGWWIAHDPATGKEIYPRVKCPECKKKYNIDRYVRYLEPCERCGHNIDWEAVKLPNK
jgi:hypothetical protein